MAEFVSQDHMSKIDRLGSNGDYLKYARQWKMEPEPDDSYKYKAIASMIEGAAGVISGLNDASDKQLQTQLSDLKWSERASEISDLENSMGLNKTVAPNQDPTTSNTQGMEFSSQNKTQSLFDWGPKEDVLPAHEQQQVNEAVASQQRMKDAIAQGKSPTHYQSRAYHEAKAIRANLNPRQRRIFDEKMGATANQYLSDLRAQQKALQTAQNDTKNKALGLLDNFAKDDVRIVPLYNDILHGRVSPDEGLTRVQSVLRPMIEAKEAEERLKKIKTNDELAKHQSLYDFRKILTSDNDLMTQTVVQQLGLSDPMKAREYLAKVEAGDPSVKASQEQIQQAGRSLNAYAAGMQKKYEELAKRTNLYVLHGPDVVNKEIEQHLKPWTDAAKYAAGGKIGMANFVVDTMKAQATDQGKNMLSRGDAFSHGLNVMNAMDAALLGNPGSFQSFIAPMAMNQSGFMSTMSQVMKFEGVRAAGQLTVPPPDGKAVTMQDTLTRLRESGLPVPTGAAMAMEQVSQFNNPKVSDDMKQSLALYYYHPDNQKLLTNFKPEQRAAIFNRLTNKDTIDAIMKASQGKHEIKAMVANWGRHVFGTELIGNEIKSLDTMVMPEGVQVRFDDKTRTLILDESKRVYKDPTGSMNAMVPWGTPGPSLADSNMPRIRQAIGNINTAIKNVSYLAETVSENPDFWIMEGLKNGGLNVDYNRIWADPKYEKPAPSKTKVNNVKTKVNNAP
jgi:hypothetical protein